MFGRVMVLIFVEKGVNVVIPKIDVEAARGVQKEIE